MKADGGHRARGKHDMSLVAPGIQPRSSFGPISAATSGCKESMIFAASVRLAVAWRAQLRHRRSHVQCMEGSREAHPECRAGDQYIQQRARQAKGRRPALQLVLLKAH